MAKMSVSGGAPGKIVVTLDDAQFVVDSHMDLYTGLWKLAELVSAPPPVKVWDDAIAAVLAPPEPAAVEEPAPETDPFPPVVEAPSKVRKSVKP